ncbi:hypothetical protein Q8A67_024013 [Cirrhinus molitorella]|uniref:Uncharacterized protein n=1 Tax=Cirrhinus molitorella TaxID=172907 RepID=A0AA88P7V9_9TELE|nr:hypothetical protein Q8A67_024013 [Cirrhinus molitorella]
MVEEGLMTPGGQPTAGDTEELEAQAAPTPEQMDGAVDRLGPLTFLSTLRITDRENDGAPGVGERPSVMPL